MKILLLRRHVRFPSDSGGSFGKKENEGEGNGKRRPDKIVNYRQ